MAKKTFDEVVWNTARSLNEINRAFATGMMRAQERNVHFAQGVYENTLAVLKSHSDAARELAEETLERPDGEILQELINTNVAAYDRNLRLAQSIFNDAIEVLKNSAQDARGLAQEFTEESQRQREQLQDFAQEATRAYVDFLRLPLAYYRQTLNKATSIT